MPIVSRALGLIVTFVAVLLATRVYKFPSVKMAAESIKRGEVYFISHGGPPTIFDYGSQAHSSWKKIGDYINKSQPKGIVAVSAHWESPENSSDVIVNVDSTNPLIYDFYGFPKHYYEQTFLSHGSEELVGDIKAALGNAGVGVTEEKRGPDHGVWVPLLVGLEGKTDIPLVQVSLPGDGTAESSVKLGKALSKLRDQGYSVLSTGQVVHNLSDVFRGRPMPYNEPFLAAVKSAVSSPDAVEETARLTKHSMFKSAHPTPEHFLGLPVAVAAADERDKLEEVYVGIDKTVKLGWGFWRWYSD